MHSRKPKTNPLRQLLVALLVSGMSVSSWSQDDPGQGEDQAKADPPVKEAAAKPAATQQASPANNNNSPFDYQASEEISQDLSVSFPVDI